MLPVIKNYNHGEVIGSCDQNNNIKFFKKEDVIDFKTQKFELGFTNDNGKIKITAISVVNENIKVNEPVAKMEKPKDDI